MGISWRYTWASTAPVVSSPLVGSADSSTAMIVGMVKTSEAELNITSGKPHILAGIGEASGEPNKKKLMDD